MSSLWVDGALSNTGLFFIDPIQKVISFGLITTPPSNHQVTGLYSRVTSIATQLSDWITATCPSVDECYVEEPPSKGRAVQASSGMLWFLQYALVHTLVHHSPAVYSVNPSFIKSAMKRVYGSDSPALRVSTAQSIIGQYYRDGYAIHGEEYTRRSSIDPQTALLFHSLSSTDGKTWPRIVV